MANGKIVKSFVGLSGYTDVGALVEDGSNVQRYFGAEDCVGFSMEQVTRLLGRSKGRAVAVTFDADGARATNIVLAAE